MHASPISKQSGTKDNNTRSDRSVVRKADAVRMEGVGAPSLERGVNPQFDALQNLRVFLPPAIAIFVQPAMSMAESGALANNCPSSRRIVHWLATVALLSFKTGPSNLGEKSRSKKASLLMRFSFNLQILLPLLFVYSLH